MSKNDFGKIMGLGFEAIWKGEESELRCFECGARAGYEKLEDGKKVVICDNSHTFNFLDFTIMYISMRDRLTEAFIDGDCKLQNK